MCTQIVEKENDDVPIDILLAEDNESDIKIALRAFKRAKLKNNIYVVEDGQQALDFIHHAGDFEDKEKYPRPGLILLDINMPKVDGVEVLRRIKSEDQYKRIPVIMLTSSKNDEDVIRSYNYGASSYIPKPIEYDDFVKVVDSFNFYWHIVSVLPKDGGS